MAFIKDIPYRPNLFLQILLFLNIYLSALALISVGFYIIFNLYNGRQLQDNLIIVLYFLGALLECKRVYLGYRGNLQSRPSDLAAFLALSSFTQVPIFTFILINVKNSLLYLNIVLGILVATICLQVILGLWSIWHLDSNDQYNNDESNNNTQTYVDFKNYSSEIILQSLNAHNLSDNLRY